MKNEEVTEKVMIVIIINASQVFFSLSFDFDSPLLDVYKCLCWNDERDRE